MRMSAPARRCLSDFAAQTLKDAAQQKTGKQKPAAAKVASPKRNGNFDLRLVGSDANSQSNAQSLKAGETSRTYVGIELGGKLGSVVQTQAQIRFTEAESDPEKSLLDLQPVNQNADARRALQDFSTISHFFGDALTVSSYQRNSSFALADTTAENAGDSCSSIM